jgi:hypothetical protein
MTATTIIKKLNILNIQKKNFVNRPNTCIHTYLLMRFVEKKSFLPIIIGCDFM